MNGKADATRWSWPARIAVALSVYAATAIPMVYWHDSGSMPDALQEIVKWMYGPLHWLIVVTTGLGNG